MQKLPYVLLFVVLALVVINIASLRQLAALEKRLIALEKKTSAPATPPASAPAATR
ncbi:hypothetical protein [Nibricoccus aquaticus]|uniref:hypothetical protein n=1 Tax=Nibricoccus aquaticus TaxID=2576891 RepID=UPI001586818A|nr:hypothetical protein [Nibricoccus aquaticus]